MVAQAAQEIVADAALWFATPFERGRIERRLSLVKSQTFGNDPVVAFEIASAGTPASDFDSVVARGWQRGRRGAENGTSPQRPRLVFIFDQRFQLAQVMRIAQRMQHAGQCEVRTPEIMNDDARDTFRHGSTLLRHAVNRQQLCAGDVQPLQNARDAQAGFIHVFDGGLFDPCADMIGQIVPVFGFVSQHHRNRGRRQIEAEQVVDQLGQPVFGDEVPRGQIHDQSRNVRAVLRRNRHVFGKHAFGSLAAVRALAGMGAMLRDFDGPELWNIEHLAVCDSRSSSRP